MWCKSLTHASLVFCFQPHSRPFVWLLTCTWIRKNTACFAVYSKVIKNVDVIQQKGPSWWCTVASYIYWNVSQYSENLLRKHLPYVSVKSKLKHAPPPPPPPGIWLFWKLLFKFPPTRAKMPFKCPTLGSIQVIKMPPPRGHFTGTKMTEGRRKRLQLLNKIFINIIKTERHC